MARTRSVVLIPPSSVATKRDEVDEKPEICTSIVFYWGAQAVVDIPAKGKRQIDIRRW